MEGVIYLILRALETNEFGKTININTPSQGGGNLRVEPSVNNQESSIGYYNRNHLRTTVAGDVWVCGINCWGCGGYTFGTPVLNSCLTINGMGNVNIPYDIKTPEIMVDRIKASTLEYMTIDDNVISAGNLVVNGSSNYEPCWVAGKVDGTNLNTLPTKGISGFTVSRASGYAAGVYYINFGRNPYDDAINVSNQESLYYNIWESSNPTVNGLYVVCHTNATTPGNATFHFSVIA